MTGVNRAGYYRRNLSGAAEYKSFVPSPLPLEPKLKLDDEIITELVKAHHNLGILEGKSSQIPNVKLFVAMYVRKEALMSSQIEGTQATLEDVLDPTIDGNVNHDVEDVVNYVRAIDAAIELLDRLPICSRLLCQVHGILLSQTRGSDKQPGEYRHSQNWIGSASSTIRTARYVPPNVEDMKEAVSNLEKYINAEEDDVDVLIKAALIHYQFETIHPFLDGNGRIGRLLTVLYLMSKGVLSTPALYISYYLKKNRIEYYDRLEAVRISGNYEQWIKFFLRAISESAESAALTIDELSKLRERTTEKLKMLGRSSKRGIKLLKYLEEYPLLERGHAAKKLTMSFRTVSLAVKDMLELGILESANSRKRKRLYYYREYLEILKSGT